MSSAEPGDRSPYTPRTFALTVDDGDDPPFVLAYGMTLPDGSAVVADASSLARCTDPRSAARMFAADLSWTDQEPGG